jgi:hypothetical protein
MIIVEVRGPINGVRSAMLTRFEPSKRGGRKTHLHAQYPRDGAFSAAVRYLINRSRS